MADLSLSSRPHSDSLIGDMRPPTHVRSSSSPISEILTFNGEEEDAVITAPAVVKKQKRKRWKKPADHPKRPLSAYNLFFQWGRERLLAGESLIPLQQDDIDQIDVDTRRNSKRRHRREHGVIGFTELAKILGTSWKSLDPGSKEMFQKRADVEKVRYEKAVRLYKAAKGDILKNDEQKKECETPPKPKRLTPKGNKIQKSAAPQSTKDIMDKSSKQKLALREEAETLQPLTYDVPNAMYRQMGAFQSNQGVFSSLFRGEMNDPYYFDHHQQQQAAFQSGNHNMHQEMSASAQSTRPSFSPQAMNQPNYMQSNSTVASVSSMRDYNESMHGNTWNTGNIPNMSSPVFHSVANQAYNNANYFDPSTRHWPTPCKDAPNRSYYNAMPSFGQQPMRIHPSGMQHPSMQSPYPQFLANFTRYPMESFNGPMNPVQSPMQQELRDDGDGLSAASPLNYFD